MSTCTLWRKAATLIAFSIVICILIYNSILMGGYHGYVDSQSNLSLMEAFLCLIITTWLHVCSMGSILSTACSPLVHILIPLHASSDACMHSVIRSGPCCALQAGSALRGSLPLCSSGVCVNVIIVVKTLLMELQTDEAWQNIYRQ